ncbi:hypothetical protein [Mucilaginibacter humi]|uniref:hypothetical protein n=1 Tax=Mucilaginibacter humi TaxID=2732510 RepID=UPI001FE5A6FF
MSRETSDQLKQANAIWAIRNKPAYPAADVDETSKNLLLYNEHTRGAFNSVSQPDNDKVKSEWAMKKGYAIHAKGLTDTLTAKALTPVAAKANAIDVYNTGVAAYRCGLCTCNAKQRRRFGERCYR